MDLGDNDLIVDYDVTSPFTTINQQLAIGAASGSWTGTGMTSSAAAGSSFAHRTALGVIEASDTGVTSFSGQNVDGTAVLVRYTYAGDANLDGSVNVQDFNRLANAYNQTNQGWLGGDFNYDGITNVQDFNLLASNYNLGFASVGNSNGLGSVVPEPTGVAALLIASSALGLRRRRR